MSFPPDKIELKLSNYNDYLPINIIAFSYATSGAMGERGGVNIISKEGQLFHFNYVDGDIKENEMYIICPPLKERIENNNIYKENWEDINLKMGNNLILHKSIYDKFQEKIKNVNTSSGRLFLLWKKIVFEILEENK